MTTIRFPSIHDIAHELREFDEMYQLITDDFKCLEAFFRKHDDAIQKEGIKVSDKLPLMATFCSYLCEKSKEISKHLIHEFNVSLLDFKASLLDLKGKDENIEEIEAIVTSTTSVNTSIMKANIGSFSEIEAQIRGADFGGFAKQDGFLKGIAIMTDLLDGRPVETDKFPKDFAEIYALYQKVSHEDRQNIKVHFVSLLELFAKAFFAQRCPISANGGLLLCANFVREFPVKPILDYLKIERSLLVLHSF